MANNPPYNVTDPNPSDSLGVPSHSGLHTETNRAIDDFSTDPAMNPPGGTTAFYRADGSWAEPQGKYAVFNVLDYGADETGVADSSTAVNNTIAAATAAGGGIVFFPVGSYALNVNVTDNDIIIAGSGQGTVLTANNGASPILSFTDVSRVGARDFRIDGEWSVGTPGGSWPVVNAGGIGLGLFGVTYSDFRNLTGLQFNVAGAMVWLQATATNNCAFNTFTHIHSADTQCFIRTVGYDGGSWGASSRYVTLNTFDSISAISASSANHILIDFYKGVDNNRFEGVTRLHLNDAGASAVKGVVYNSGASGSDQQVYENHFVDLMVDNFAANNVPVEINYCTNPGGGSDGRSEINLRTGGDTYVAPTVSPNGRVRWLPENREFSNATRYAADDEAPGATIWNTDTSGLEYSDGTSWIGTVASEDSSVGNIVALTQAAYDAIVTKDPKTLYVITD